MLSLLGSFAHFNNEEGVVLETPRAFAATDAVFYAASVCKERGRGPKQYSMQLLWARGEGEGQISILCSFCGRGERERAKAVFYAGPAVFYAAPVVEGEERGQAVFYLAPVVEGEERGQAVFYAAPVVEGDGEEAVESCCTGRASQRELKECPPEADTVLLF